MTLRCNSMVRSCFAAFLCLGTLPALSQNATRTAADPTKQAEAVQQAEHFAGTWVMRLGERTLFVLTLTSKNEDVLGSFDRPAEFSSEGNTIFSNMHGGLRHDPVVEGRVLNGSLHLTVQSAENPKDKSRYIMSVHENLATLSPDDDPAPNTPYQFQRTAGIPKVSTNWEPNRAYSISDLDNPNAEMKAIYDEDQRVREKEPIDWDAVNKSDAQRREQTRKLLDAGVLHTGSDYEEAAFIFQHAQTTDDFLLAHTLAMVAISKGDAGAIWIATATLDRYLQRIGQKQIYGTQYLSDANNHFTQEPYARDLVPDALREQLGAQPLAVDKERLDWLQSQHPVPGKK